MQGFAGRCRAVSRCSVVAGAAAGLLLPERFSRCCPQPGYRSGCDQGPPGGDPRPAPLHGPGQPGDIEHDGIGFAGDREHRQPPRVAQAPPHAEDHPHDVEASLYWGVFVALKKGAARDRWRSRRRAAGVCVPAAAGASVPGLRNTPSLCSRWMFCCHVLSHLGRGRRFRAHAPRHQPVASSARPRGQGPPPAPGGPVPGPDGGLGHNGGDTGHPSEHPRGPDPVQNGQRRPQHLGPAVITSHPGIVAQATRSCQAPGLPPPRGCRPAGAGRRRRSAPAVSALASPPLTCSTGISSPGCGARVTSCSPVRKYPAPAVRQDHQYRLDVGPGRFVQPVPALAYNAAKGAVVNLTRELGSNTPRRESRSTRCAPVSTRPT